MYLSIRQESQPAVRHHPVLAVSKTSYEALIRSDGTLKYSCHDCGEVRVSKSSPGGVQPRRVFSPTRQNCLGSQVPGREDRKPGTAAPLQDWIWLPACTHTFWIVESSHLEPF